MIGFLKWTTGIMLLVSGAALTTMHSQQPITADEPRKLRFEKLTKVPSGALDAFITVESQAKRAIITLAFDNPCSARPIGHYRVVRDTLIVSWKYWPDLPATCPAIWWPEAFLAQTDPLPPGRYTVRAVVSFNKGRSEQVYWRKVEIN